MPCDAPTLGSESPYLLAKFASLDSGGSQNVLDIKSVDGDTLETIVGALYSGKIKLSKDNIERLLHCADMLQVG